MLTAFIHELTHPSNVCTAPPIAEPNEHNPLQVGIPPHNTQSLQPSTIQHLLSLEESLHQRKYTLNQLNDMLYTYARLVELFDEQKGFATLKQYFLEKMQFLLSRPESIKLMMEQDQKI